MNVVRRIVTAAEILLAVGLIGLEFLSSYRAGVMQYLFFHKVHYQATLYGQETLMYHFGFLAVCFLAVVWLSRGRRGFGRLLRSGYATLICLGFLAALFLPVFQEVAVYPYLLMTLELILFVETAWETVLYIAHRRWAER